MNFRKMESAHFRLTVLFGVALALCFVTRSFSFADDEFPSDIMDSVEPPQGTAKSEPEKVPPVETPKAKVKAEHKVEKKPESKPKTMPVAKAVVKESPAKEEGIKTLKAIDKRYQAAKSIIMDVDKTLVNSVIGTEKKSKGSITLSKGRMRMEIVEPNKSTVVIDGKTIWVADYPKAELKDAPVQVLKGSVKESKGASKSFVGLLAQGAITKYFKVIDVQKDESGRRIYFMQPSTGSVEFKRSQITLTADEKQIAELRYWDEQDNETRMIFSNVKFDKPVSEETFQFKLPPNADVSQI